MVISACRYQAHLALLVRSADDRRLRLKWNITDFAMIYMIYEWDYRPALTCTCPDADDKLIEPRGTNECREPESRAIKSGVQLICTRRRRKTDKITGVTLYDTMLDSLKMSPDKCLGQVPPPATRIRSMLLLESAQSAWVLAVSCAEDNGLM